ncbi:ABC transporter ATP-binding protein [Lyngbya sp. CCY1209]|uniref:metal ABC transporter ATP-binding protein n=1 Tax=Lyngbya sp. CCY1209 TaxID=2886103 RepID=UPI002D2065FD|nr:ABC transporter ATP-binding protein [Lyngbya sp. CCY1209]MEB3882191.1 ABC transporter ATP-binding protein [Lyngbya sp. CCY1209]
MLKLGIDVPSCYPSERSDPPTEAVMTLDRIWASYNRQEPVLEDVSLTVRELDFIGIIGPNGGGKTTLLKVMLGLLKPRRGTVEIMGFSPVQGRRYVGYVPQTFEFDRSFPVRVSEVVLMGRLGRRRLFRGYTKQDREIVNRTLEKVGMLEFRDRAIGELSGGQRQRIYIARALACEPRILLLDEPTASVDPRMQYGIYELLHELNEYMTIVIISHDLGAVSTHVKTVGCLNRKLFYHGDRQITPEMIEQTYQCPIDLISHGSIPHRVFRDHQ